MKAFLTALLLPSPILSSPQTNAQLTKAVKDLSTTVEAMRSEVAHLRKAVDRLSAPSSEPRIMAASPAMPTARSGSSLVSAASKVEGPHCRRGPITGCRNRIPPRWRSFSGKTLRR